MRYIDMHCDTLAKALMQGKRTVEVLEGTMADLRRLKKSGAKAQFFAMFLPQKPDPGWLPQAAEVPDFPSSDPQRVSEYLMDKMYQIYQNTLADCSDSLAAAGTYRDLGKNERDGKISAFLTIENGFLVRGDLEKLGTFYDMGVRLITLTWNDPNCFGYPHSADREEMGRGLTPFGKDAVAVMNDLGMLVDVSHLSDGGFYDVADISKKPFVASHSDCRALCPGATRNLTDEMIRILAEKGGVAGINFEPTFLNEDPRDHVSRISRICDHIFHLIDKGGSECVGIGTDFDGIYGEFEIADCTGMPLLFEELRRRGLPESAVEKIARGNVERVIRDVLG